MDSSEMFVDFEFELETSRFAINRKKTRRKTAQLQLFQVGADGTRTPLTGSVMRETQNDINRRVLFDYDTFLNSVFIAQGRADEFTRKPAGERKRVLRNVLGLERYEDYSQRARTLGRERDVELRSLRERIEEAGESIEQLPELREQIAALERDLERTQAESGEATALVDSLQTAAREFARRKTAVSEATAAVPPRGGSEVARGREDVTREVARRNRLASNGGSRAQGRGRRQSADRRECAGPGAADQRARDPARRRGEMSCLPVAAGPDGG